MFSVVLIIVFNIEWTAHNVVGAYVLCKVLKWTMRQFSDVILFVFFSTTWTFRRLHCTTLLISRAVSRKMLLSPPPPPPPPPPISGGVHPNSSLIPSISSSETFSNILDDFCIAKTNFNEREKQSCRSCPFIYRKVPPFCIPRCSSLKTSAYLRLFLTTCDRACASICF